MDRSEAVTRLVQTFRHYGYEGATLSRISKATGLGKASLYHHFPQGKKEMAEAVLEHVLKWFQANVLNPLHEDIEPAKRLQAMNDSLSQFYDHGRDACLLALFSLGEPDDLFHRQVNQALTIWIRELEQVFADAGLPPQQARQQAEDVVMRIQGALVLARGLDSTEPFDRVLREVSELLPSSSTHTLHQG